MTKKTSISMNSLTHSQNEVINARNNTKALLDDAKSTQNSSKKMIFSPNVVEYT